MKNNLRNGLAALLMLSCTCAYAQMSGTYTIGGDNPDFTTINAAYNALKAQGASGDITFDIRPGTYNEILRFMESDFPDGLGGFLLKGTNAIITSSDNMATILDEFHGMKFEGLTVKNTGTGVAFCFSAASFCEVNNCTFQSTGSAALSIIHDSDCNVIQNSTIIGGDYGVFAMAPTVYFYDNTVSNFNKAGFASFYDEESIDHNGHKILRNIFRGIKSSSNSKYCAIQFDDDYENIVEDNEIVLYSTTVSNNMYGIYDYGSGSRNRIYTNNYIEVWGGAGIKSIGINLFNFTNNSILSSYGKGVDVEAYTINLTNNEVVSYKDDCINATGNVTAINNSTFLYNSSTGSAFRATTGTKIVNNSFFNSSTNANTSAINLKSVSTCDYNNLYSLSSKLGVFNNVSKVSLSAWRSATGKDSHSISVDPLYSDPELCSMQINLSSPLVNRALASEMPSYDITGEARDYNAIGAWDPYPHTSWYTRSARQRAYDIRKAIRENVEMQSLQDEQNAETSNIATLQYSINYSSGLLNVISSEKEDATYTLCIADMLTGETRIQTPAILVDGISQSVDLSALASGYYVVRLVTDADIYSWKISK